MMYSSSNNNTPQDNYHTQSFSSSFLLPSPTYIPLEDEAVFCEFFKQQFFSHDHNYHNSIILADEMTNHMEECGNNNGNAAMNHVDDDQWDINNAPVEPESSSPRKRPSRRDRHSKINTAQGPRDRRMRLSLDVAKKLFGLQDLLGFDKASKTVDWLLTKSKTSILELLPDPSCSFIGASNSASSTSECEVLSGTVDQSMLKTGDDDQETTRNKAKSSESSKKQKEKSSKGVRRCTDFHHPLARATRERARERARERTISKRNNKHGGDDQVSKFRPFLDQAADQDANQLGFWSTSEERQRQSNDQLGRMSSKLQTNPGFFGDNSSLLMTGNWSPNYLFNYQHSFGQYEHQVNEYQLIGEAWEGNYN